MESLNLVLTQTNGPLAQLYQQAQADYAALIARLNRAATPFSLPTARHQGPVITLPPAPVRRMASILAGKLGKRPSLYRAAHIAYLNPNYLNPNV